MAGGHLEFAEGPEEVDLDVKNIGPGGGGRPYLQYVLQIIYAVDTLFVLETWVMTPWIG